MLYLITLACAHERGLRPRRNACRRCMVGGVGASPSLGEHRRGASTSVANVGTRGDSRPRGVVRVCAGHRGPPKQCVARGPWPATTTGGVLVMTDPPPRGRTGGFEPALPCARGQNVALRRAIFMSQAARRPPNRLYSLPKWPWRRHRRRRRRRFRPMQPSPSPKRRR